MNLEDILRNKRRAIFDKTMWMLVSVSVVMMIIAQFILRTINDDVCTIIFSIAASILASVIVSTFTQKYNVNGIDDEIIERFDVLKIYQNYSLRGIYTGFPFENKKI
ncbi:MAG: hypothetical protein E7272_07170 [Pseudobutyrivibrio ruminis]|uniref:Uncharacterized protein n=1 Tax=Pseudobutyrivibrio ruminis TaxID=46206 RepID=A0A927U9J8_9FIRM|nr:hypothetical protein [Pseudobutyrivibrio ruminis]